MNHPHNHNPDATWETHLVIPEATVDPVLATLLRIEEILKGIVEGGIPRPTLTDRAADPLTPELLGFEQVEDKKNKGLNDAHTSEELQAYDDAEGRSPANASKTKGKRK